MPRAIFRLRGRVVHHSGEPAEGVIVALVDADPDLDDLIAVGVTDADGCYRASFTTDAFNQEEGEAEKLPDLYAMVSVANGVSITPMVRHEFRKLRFHGVEDVGDIRLPPPFQIPPLGASSYRVAPGRGKMVKRLRLDDELVALALDEVAPIVEKLTGFSGLRRDVRFVILDDFFENRRARWEKRVSEKLSAKQLARVVEQARECDASLVAEWDAETREVLLNRQFLEAQSFDYFKTSLGHELVHVGQSNSDPAVDARHRSLTQRMWPHLLAGVDVPADVLRELTVHMANIEGYAEYIESHYLQKLYTHSELLGHAVRAADERFRNLRATKLTDEELSALSAEEIVERYGASKRIQYLSGARAYAERGTSMLPAPFDPELRPPIIPDVERILAVLAAKVAADAKAPAPGKKTYPRERTCAACDATTRVGEYHDPNIPTSSAALRGLDGRPGFDAMFFGDAFFIEWCKSCGHLAPNLEAPYPRLAKVKEERAELLALPNHDARALRCLVVANLFADVDYLEEGRWALRAAWFDEAAGQTDSARPLRRRAGYCFVEAMREGRALAQTRLATSLLVAETLRVGKARERAREHALRGLRYADSAPERERELLLFELEAIGIGWNHPLTCGDALASFAMLEPDRIAALEKTIATEAAALPPLRLRPTLTSIAETDAIVFALDFMDETLMIDLLREGRSGIWEAVSLRPRLLPALLRATADEDIDVRTHALALLRDKTFPFPPDVVQGASEAVAALLRRLDDPAAGVVRTTLGILRQLLLLEPSFAPEIANGARTAMPRWHDDRELFALFNRLLEAAAPSKQGARRARSVGEMRLAASLRECSACHRRVGDAKMQLFGVGDRWSLAGRCAHCGGSLVFGFDTYGDPTKGAGEQPSELFTPSELASELDRARATKSFELLLSLIQELLKHPPEAFRGLIGADGTPITPEWLVQGRDLFTSALEDRVDNLLERLFDEADSLTVAALEEMVGLSLASVALDGFRPGELLVSEDEPDGHVRELAVFYELGEPVTNVEDVRLRRVRNFAITFNHRRETIERVLRKRYGASANELYGPWRITSDHAESCRLTYLGQ